MKFLLQPEAFIHQPLESRPVENIVSKLFIGKHAQSSATGIRGHLCRLFQRQIGILADHRHHHAHHDLQAPESSRLVRVLIVFAAWLFGSLNFHTAPVFFGFIRWIWMLAAFPALAPIAGSNRYCGTFRPRIKLPLAVHLCDPQDNGIVTAVIC